MINTANEIQLPIDINTINATAEEISMKQIEVVAEKLKLDDLSEIIKNFKQLTDAFLQVKDSDYIDQWFAAIQAEKKWDNPIQTEEPLQTVNNSDYKEQEVTAKVKKPRSLQEALKQNAA